MIFEESNEVGVAEVALYSGTWVELGRLNLNTNEVSPTKRFEISSTTNHTNAQLLVIKNRLFVFARL